MKTRTRCVCMYTGGRYVDARSAQEEVNNKITKYSQSVMSGETKKYVTIRRFQEPDDMGIGVSCGNVPIRGT